MSRTPNTNQPAAARVRRRLDVRGQVQGVGFRPFVYRLATDLHLAGRVGNDPKGAFIEIEGDPTDVESFLHRLRAESPPLTRIDRVAVAEQPARSETAFAIRPSATDGRQEARITPDTAMCDDCRREMLDPANRRYRYPFINCTNCGPRYSIIQAVPYDRPNTTMGAFTMCPACQAEYDDPTDRRFHAQPNACPVCGPHVRLTDAEGTPIVGDAVAGAATLLREGKIVAVKGLGGFHLACRADSDEAVARLRRRKRRESKPLAVMVASTADAESCAHVDAPAAAALANSARPIVLTPKRDASPLSELVAPGVGCVGLMLPYTPLHVLLLAETAVPLVMTSGNPTDEPLCSDNDEALRRLGSIADAFLLHDRDIARRVDDSVVMIVAEPTPHAAPLRRARGYVPAPITVAHPASEPILAVGAEMKSAVCLLDGEKAVLSEHLGELPNSAAFRNFLAAIDQFKRLLNIEPATIAYDLHPNYAATRFALTQPGRLIGVQHHHAHVVSCMADNGLTGDVIGVVCDGTGYGTDGAVWGGEIFIADERRFRRAAHLWNIPLPGGDTAARQTWRPALGWLRESFGDRWSQATTGPFQRVDEETLRLAVKRMNRPGLVRVGSSLGRLFDAVAFLLNLCQRNRHEAEAAMAVEAAAGNLEAEPLAYDVVDGDGPLRLDARPTIRQIFQQINAGRDRQELARAFHETLAAMFADGVVRIAEATGLTRVVLTGGCFANRLLLEGLAARLTETGLSPATHWNAPPGDGGIALGQAVAAAAAIG